MWGTSGGSITKWGKKLYFYPVRLFRTIDKVVPKTALFTSHLVFGFIGWSIKMSKCCQNCTYPHSVCTGDHFVGQSQSFACCIGDYLVAHSQSFATNCALSHSACIRDHLMAHCQSFTKNCTFLHSACIADHLVAHCQSFAKNCTSTLKNYS